MKYLLLLILFSSCSVERRLQRFCKRNPELCRTDTIVIPATTVRIDTVLQVDTVQVSNTAEKQTTAIDSLLSTHNIQISKLRKQVQNQLQRILQQSVGNLIVWPNDTIIGYNNGTVVKVWFNKGRVEVLATTPRTTHTTQTIIQKPPNQKTWWERWDFWIGILLGLVFWLLVIHFTRK